MSNEEQWKIACPHCGWHATREKWRLERDQLVQCQDCFALISTEQSVDAARRPEVLDYRNSEIVGGVE